MIHRRFQLRLELLVVEAVPAGACRCKVFKKLDSQLKPPCEVCLRTHLTHNRPTRRYIPFGKPISRGFRMVKCQSTSGFLVTGKKGTEWEKTGGNEHV